MKDSATGLYTQKQIDYVNSIKKEDLRDLLLYNIRLKDIMKEDRDKFEKKLINKSDLKECFKTVFSAIKNDEGIRIGWTANIAMAFYDEFNAYVKFNEGQVPDTVQSDIHTIANRAANNFIEILCQYE